MHPTQQTPTFHTTLSGAAHQPVGNTATTKRPIRGESATPTPFSGNARAMVPTLSCADHMPQQTTFHTSFHPSLFKHLISLTHPDACGIPLAGWAAVYLFSVCFVPRVRAIFHGVPMVLGKRQVQDVMAGRRGRCFPDSLWHAPWPVNALMEVIQLLHCNKSYMGQPCQEASTVIM